MKAIEINGEVKTFSRIPKIWEDRNGVHLNIVNPSEFGFKDVVVPDYDPRIQELGEIILDKNVFVYKVVDKDIKESIQELKERKISELKNIANSKLDSIQWYWDRSLRTNGSKPVPSDVIELDSKIRTECDKIEESILSLSKKKDIVTFDIYI